MTEPDPLDVEVGAKALRDAWMDSADYGNIELAESVLAAVLPSHDRRLLLALADEIESLTIPPREFQGSEAVGLLRAANVIRAAAGVSDEPPSLTIEPDTYQMPGGLMG